MIKFEKLLKHLFDLKKTFVSLLTLDQILFKYYKNMKHLAQFGTICPI